MNYAGQRLGDHDHWLVEGLTGWHVQLGIVSTEGCFEWLASTTRMQHLLLWWCTQCSTWKILYLQPVVDMEYIGIIRCFWFFFGHEKLLSDRNGLGAIELAESTCRERFSWACLCHLCGILRYGLKLVWISVSGGPCFKGTKRKTSSKWKRSGFCLDWGGNGCPQLHVAGFGGTKEAAVIWFDRGDLALSSTFAFWCNLGFKRWVWKMHSC